MPIIILSCGASVVIDDEDAELMEIGSWHVYRIRNSMKPAVARGQKRYGRMFRMHLHREVAARRDPGIIGYRFRVIPKNGDYLDCRRENLDVVLAKKKRGPKPIESRPLGWEQSKYKGQGKRNADESTSPLWAGGYTIRQIDRWKHGQGRRYKRCIGGVPVD